MHSPGKIFARTSKRASTPGGYFYLEEEKSRTRVQGYGHGDHIKLADEYGSIWHGSATRNPDSSVVYRFRDGRGKTLSGVSYGTTITLRDERGLTWKGFVD